MTVMDAEFLWGSRTARIAYACRACDLVAGTRDDDVLVRFPWLIEQAKQQAERYHAGIAFAAGYIEGALCTVWRRYGWDKRLWVNREAGKQWLTVPEPEWWEDWPPASGLVRIATDYAPLFPLEIAW